jgi:hypothetical protein
MELYDVVKFAHIATLLAAIGLAGYLHATEWHFRGATSLAELRLLFAPQKWGVLFAPIVGLLLLEGMWLLQLSEDEAVSFEFTEGWVWTAVVALVILFGAGAGIEGPHGERTGKALAALGDGPVTPEARALVASKVGWLVGHGSTGLAVAVACNMVNKPGTPVAILVLVVGSAIGAAIGLMGSRRSLA